jgi:uncharacterized protein YkwD
MVRGLYAFLATLAFLLPAASAAGSTSHESAVLQEMNRVRAEHGLSALHYDGHLHEAAVAHSREMIATNVFEHGAFSYRLAQFDITSRIAGENLAWGTGSRGTARAIVAAWLASPEHRANLLRTSFNRVGVGDLTGRFQGHTGAHVVTADFAG